MNFFLGLFFGWLFSRKGLPIPTPGGGTPGPVPTTPPGGFQWPWIPAGWKPPEVPPVIPGGGPPPPPDGGGGPPAGPPPGGPPEVKVYTIKSGDYPSGLAAKRTGNAGRWRELLQANPEMSTYTDSKGQTQIKPWQVGQKIVLPPGW